MANVETTAVVARSPRNTAWSSVDQGGTAAAAWTAAVNPIGSLQVRETQTVTSVGYKFAFISSVSSISLPYEINASPVTYAASVVVAPNMPITFDQNTVLNFLPAGVVPTGTLDIVSVRLVVGGPVGSGQGYQPAEVRLLPPVNTGTGTVDDLAGMYVSSGEHVQIQRAAAGSTQYFPPGAPMLHFCSADSFQAAALLGVVDYSTGATGDFVVDGSRVIKYDDGSSDGNPKWAVPIVYMPHTGTASYDPATVPTGPYNPQTQPSIGVFVTINVGVVRYLRQIRRDDVVRQYAARGNPTSQQQSLRQGPRNTYW